MKSHLFLAILLWVLVSCRNNTAKESLNSRTAAESTEESWDSEQIQEEEFPPMPLKELVAALQDSVEHTWYLSVKSDENKLAKILKLTAQLEKYPAHDKKVADSIKLMHRWLSAHPLTWEVLADTTKTLLYDNNFDILMQLVRRLKNTPGSESCTLCTELYQEIIAAYDDDLILRRRYDKAALMLNKLIDKKQDSIKLLPPPLNKVSRKPLFMPQIAESL
ncbi:MAG: hypothetical protein RMJ44_02000 [Cytophagales bacterium]|nr:hypothetical protein [Bernardetiaceae bacterium]MDW8209834.1 hypothetical protein [Cytophagales bacterium]